MALLLKNIEELKDHVSVNKNLKYDSVKPYIKQAERKFIKSIIGKALYTEFTAETPKDVLKIEVYELLCEASANLTWLLYLPLAQVQVTDSSVAVINSQSSKAAEWWQIRDLIRSFADAGFYALDEALKIMEANEGNKFDAWKTTDGFTIFNELFVTRTETFERWFSIGKNRRTFLALRPKMLEVQHQYFAKLDANTIVTIKAAGNAVKKSVLDKLQAAQVNYAIAKIAETGMFDITSTGLYAKLEEFPGYRAKTLEPAQLQALSQNRLIAAEQFYKMALDEIKANPDDFDSFNLTSAGTFVKPKNTKSIVSFG